MRTTTVINLQKENIKQLISGSKSIAPLVSFRIIFGLIMVVSLIRFASNGWIHEFYIAPQYHFTFFSLDWIKPLSGNGMYVLFILMGVAAFFIAIGFLYRLATITFFLIFTYVELIDKTYYLNHYYFISIIGFLLIWVPANAHFSIDSFLRKSIITTTVPAWTISIFKLQLALVYFYAGLAKVNPDWLWEALPLKIWLPARAHFPLIGGMLEEPLMAYVFSWSGMLFDLSIPFLLIWSRTRSMAYLILVFFHMMTWLMFPIGMFPFIMIGLTLIFFSEGFHNRMLHFKTDQLTKTVRPVNLKWNLGSKMIALILIIHFSIQIILPFRYSIYPGKLFWTEQGYRFSWRVMLMEKAGFCQFYIKKDSSKEPTVINNRLHLTENQERMMATQPDMILQFAHFIKDTYQADEVYVDSIVTLQGVRSKTFIDPSVNLAQVKRNLHHKNWIIPFETIQ